MLTALARHALRDARCELLELGRASHRAVGARYGPAVDVYQAGRARLATMSREVGVNLHLV